MRAAHRALIISERRLLPSGVIPPPRFFDLEDFVDVVDLLPVLLDFVELDEPLLVRAQRARAAAASFARVAADMGRRRPSVLVAADEEELLAVLVLPPVLPPRPPPKSELSRFSSDWICSRSETASFNFSSDRSMRLSYAKRT